MQFRKNTLCLAMQLALACVGAEAQSAQIVDNDAVLLAWAQSTGSAPELVTESVDTTSTDPVEQELPTRLEWHLASAFDAYHTEASGGSVLNAKTTGDYQRFDVSGDMLQTASDGSVTQGRLSLTASGDRSVNSADMHVVAMQLGHQGSGYQLAFGDVAASYSSLGINAGLRGVQWQQQFGKGSVSAIAGVMAQSWETLAGQVDATTMQRNIVGMKADFSVAPGVRTFLTVASFGDDPASLGESATVMAPLSGEVASAGFGWAKGRGSVQLEAAGSRAKERGAEQQSDSAWLLDGTWALSPVTLRGGLHDVGQDFVGVSGQAASGIKEGYVNVVWPVARWLSLSSDVRRSENRPKVVVLQPGQIQPASQSDRIMMTASIQYPGIPGLSTQLSYSTADGENTDGSLNRNSAGGVNMTYSAGNWFTGFGYQHLQLDNRQASQIANSASTDTFNVNCGRNWAELAGWQLGSTVSANSQNQIQDTGASSRSESGTLQLNARHGQYGAINLSLMTGGVTNPLDNNRLTHRQSQLDYQHGLGRRGQFRVYWKDNDSLSGSASTAYSDTTVGIQIALSI